MLARAISAAVVLLLAGSSSAQMPPELGVTRGPPPVTPLKWKHEWLSRRNTSWDYVGQAGRPLVINLPAAPGEYPSGLDAYMWRLFYDEGYALGAVVWHDQRSQRQSAREDVAEITSEVAEVRANPARFGGFDPSRIIVAAWGDDAFPAALVAFDSGKRGSSPVCAALFIDAMNFDTTNAESVVAKRKFADDPNPAELAPLRHTTNAPPTLLMTEALDATAARRSDALANAIRATGGIAIRATYPKFRDNDPTTYLGYSENPSTQIIRDFLKTYCPAEVPRAEK